MIKKCMGCGVTLQSEDEKKVGYTPDINKDLCMRCFKLKHYNILTDEGILIDNEKLLKKINAKKYFVLFLVDYLNINEEVISIYQKITTKKALIITKSDLVPKNIKINTLIENIKNIYDIKEIYYCSSNTKENINVLTNICQKERKVIMAGFTNAGKSSLINALVGSDITVSAKSNTTQDFIRINTDDIVIYDAPGFISKNFYEELPKKRVVPITYQIKKQYYLKLAEIDLYFKSDCNITIYMKDIKIEKRKLKEDIKCDIIIPSNSDLVIKGLGFIKFSTATYIGLNLNSDIYEVRPSIIGGKNE